jgi:hypothetical protein
LLTIDTLPLPNSTVQPVAGFVIPLESAVIGDFDAMVCSIKPLSRQDQPSEAGSTANVEAFEISLRANTLE